MRYPRVKIGRKGKTDLTGAVFFIPFPDLFADISLRVVSDLQEFRMLSKIFQIFGCDFFSIAESLLPIVSWIFQTFIEIEFQNSITSWLLYHEHATHATNKWEKFDKKIQDLCGL